jgi:hypothetical protein
MSTGLGLDNSILILFKDFSCLSRFDLDFGNSEYGQGQQVDGPQGKQGYDIYHHSTRGLLFFVLVFRSEFSVSVSSSSPFHHLSAISFGRNAAVWTLKG